MQASTASKELKTKNHESDRKKLRLYTSIFMLCNQLAFAVIYNMLAILYARKILQEKTRIFLQAWLVLHSASFVVVGIISFIKINQYEGQGIKSKLYKAIDVVSLAMDVTYFICEILIFIEIFKKFSFGAPITKDKISAYEIIVFIVLAICCLISFVNAVDSALTLNKSRHKNEVITLVYAIIGLISVATCIAAYVVSNLETRAIINTRSEAKMLGLGLFIAAALLGVFSAILNVYKVHESKSVATVEPMTEQLILFS